MKVLLAAYEAAPIVKYGGLGDVVGSLPKALSKLGVEVGVALPGYPFIERMRCLPGSEVPVYYVESTAYFDDPAYEAYHSGLERNRHRFAFFSQAVVSALPEWGVEPDVIHIHDWHTALIPSILEVRARKKEFYGRIATLLTIHNLAFHGEADPQVLAEAQLSKDSLETIAWDVNHWNPKGTFDVNFLAQGIMQADLVNTVSPSYAEEIKTAEFGEGLEELIQAREARVYGILNGIDYGVWNPARDNYIYDIYDIENVNVKKRVNKSELLKELELEDIVGRPLLAFVGRLTDQKGVDLLLESIPTLVENQVSLVILGTGVEQYEQDLADLARRWPDQVAAHLKFNEALAHKIYAGADILLIPSHYEPCGLIQMIAMRYGTIPVARAVGGLKDTIEDEMTGFLFQDYSGHAFLEAVERVLKLYRKDRTLRQDPILPGEGWVEMVRRAMKQDFSWDRSAQEYVKLYEKAVDYRKLEVEDRGQGGSFP